jgi:hypothetical protein
MNIFKKFEVTHKPSDDDINTTDGITVLRVSFAPMDRSHE